MLALLENIRHMGTKITYGVIGVLVVLLAVSVYSNFQTESGGSLNGDVQRVQKADNTAKITNLYNQTSSTLPSHDLYCIPSKKSYCTLEGCKDVEANVFVLLGKTQGEDELFMARCDEKPCDTYDVNLSQSGVFTPFETKEPHVILFRTSNLDQSYIEVVTLGTESFISSGLCYSK